MAVLVCPNCKSILSEYDIHTDSVVCIQCNFDVDIKAGLVADLPKDHKVVIGNEGVIIQKSASQINFELEWKHFSHWKFNFTFGLGITVIFGTLLFFFASNSFLFTIIGSVFLFMGIYLLYLAWFLYFNKTTISINHTHLVVQHLYNSKRLQPIESIQSRDINQVFIRRKSAGSSNGNQFYNHEIFLKTKSGKEHLMVNPTWTKTFFIALSAKNLFQCLNLLVYKWITPINNLRSIPKK